MTKFALASVQLRELLRPRRSGEPVNVHVVDSVKEPQPDFDAMQRAIEQKFDSPQPPKQERDDSI